MDSWWPPGTYKSDKSGRHWLDNPLEAQDQAVHRVAAGPVRQDLSTCAGSHFSLFLMMLAKMLKRILVMVLMTMAETLMEVIPMLGVSTVGSMMLVKLQAGETLAVKIGTFPHCLSSH